jgi:hypothetical protein
LNSEQNLTVIFGKETYNTEKIFFVNEEFFRKKLMDENSHKEAILFLEKIQESILNENSILEILQYGNTSLWWFLYPTLFPIIKRAILFLNNFNKFLDEKKPSLVIIKDNFNYFEIICQVCNIKKIPIKFSQKNYMKFKMKEKIIILDKIRHEKIFSQKIKTRKNLFTKNKNPSSFKIGGNLIFVSPTIYRRKNFDAENEKFQNNEFIFQQIIDMLKNEYPISGIDVDYTFRGDPNILKERLKSNTDWTPIESLLNFKKTNLQKNFLKNYELLISRYEFKKLFEFNGVNIWKLVSTTFLQMTYSHSFPFFLNLLDSFDELFSKFKPKTIFLLYETGPLVLPVIIAAKKYKIKTVGFAHSIIPKLWAKEMYLFRKDTPLCFPIPDYTLVFGKFSKDNLVEYGYPEKQIKIFGNPTFFNFEKIKNYFDKKLLDKKYNIKSDQKVILFTTQYLQKFHTTHGGFDYDVQILEELINNFGNSDEFKIIVKPHPSENIHIYKTIIDKNNIKNFEIIEENLFELIAISDIVLSVYSYSMMDAICFRKPVIRVIFDNFDPKTLFDEFNGISKCHIKELSNEIKKILFIKQSTSENIDEYEIFIKEQYHIPENNPKLELEKILNS